MVKEVVKRHVNRPAKIVGLLGIFIYLCLGYYLKIKLMYDYENWTKNFALMKNYLRAAHVHGLLMSVILLFYAFLVEFAELGGQLKRVGTYLAIAGTILVPLNLVGSAFGFKNALLSHLGVLMVLTAVGILVWGHLKKG